MHQNNHCHRNTLVLNTTKQYELHTGVHSNFGGDVKRMWYPSSTAKNVESIIVPDRRFITLQGDLGAGKSDAAKKLEKETRILRLSGGTFMRVLAEQNGISLDEMTERAKKDPQYDIEANRMQVMRGDSDIPGIIDGRVGPMTIPHSLKVLMIVDPEVAAERIYSEYIGGGRKGEAQYDSATDVEKANAARKRSDEERYLQIYGLQVNDKRLYDMVIDTTRMKVDEVVEAIRGYQSPRDNSIIHVSR